MFFFQFIVSSLVLFFGVMASVSVFPFLQFSQLSSNPQALACFCAHFWSFSNVVCFLVFRLLSSFLSSCRFSEPSQPSSSSCSSATELVGQMRLARSSWLWTSSFCSCRSRKSSAWSSSGWTGPSLCSWGHGREQRLLSLRRLCFLWSSPWPAAWCCWDLLSPLAALLGIRLAAPSLDLPVSVLMSSSSSLSYYWISVSLSQALFFLATVFRGGILFWIIFFFLSRRVCG